MKLQGWLTCTQTELDWELEVSWFPGEWGVFFPPQMRLSPRVEGMHLKTEGKGQYGAPKYIQECLCGWKFKRQGLSFYHRKGVVQARRPQNLQCFLIDLLWPWEAWRRAAWLWTSPKVSQLPTLICSAILSLKPDDLKSWVFPFGKPEQASLTFVRLHGSPGVSPSICFLSCYLPIYGCDCPL